MNDQIARQLPSVCPLDCPDTCSLMVSIDDGKITKVRGSKVNPFTQGSVCNKVAKYYPEFVHGKHRLSQPLLRTGPRGAGEYRAISWDEALDRVHEGVSDVIKRHGPQAVLPLNYAGPHGKLAGGSMDQRFFSRLGASDLNRSPLCGGVRSLAYKSMFGSAQGMSPEQVRCSDLILIWGTNITVSNLHLMREINVARKRGATLVVIDPRETQVAKQADLFLQVKPGSDVALALKAIAYLDSISALNNNFPHPVYGLDEFLVNARSYKEADLASLCGIDNAAFLQFVALCQNAKRLALSTGVGLERSRNGGASITAALSLAVLLGEPGKVGHGVMGSYSKAFKSNDLLHNKADQRDAKQRRIFNIVDTANHLLDKSLEDPIQAVFIYNHNPMATHPEQNKMRAALSQEDLFIVGCDVQMNDSMLYCDIILPAATHFEHADIFASYGHTYLQRAEPVIDQVGESLANTEIFRRLAKKFGFTESAFSDSDEALIDQAFHLTKKDNGVERASQLSVEQVLKMQAEDRCWLSEKQLDTPTQKIELLSPSLGETYRCALPKYQPITQDAEFILISPASARRINASFGGSSESEPEYLEINPQDAARHHILDGDCVMLYNGLGQVQLLAKITTAVVAGVLCCEKGAWCKSSVTGQTVNALISNASKTDIGEGAAYYDTFVNIRKIDSSSLAN